MRKCCLNCVFCIHHKEKLVNNGLHFYHNNIESILSSDERKQAFIDNFNFIGQEIKEKRAWEMEYNQKLDDLKNGIYNSILGGPKVLDLLMKEETHKGCFYLANEFGMSSYPDAPDADYLACWHKLWNFRNNEKELTSLKNKCKCLFFYPYNRKENKSFEGCEKERVALLDQKHFAITNALVIAGIIVTILIYFLQKY